MRHSEANYNVLKKPIQQLNNGSWTTKLGSPQYLTLMENVHRSVTSERKALLPCLDNSLVFAPSSEYVVYQQREAFVLITTRGICFNH